MANKPSIKAQIICQLMATAEAMIKNGSGIRTVKRVISPFLNEQITPALHLMIGHEQVIDQDERGYNCQFPASFKLILESKGDARYAQGDSMEAYLITLMEADEQLGGLASKITFMGAQPYIDEIIPNGFILVNYKIEYRRMKAQPDIGY